MSMSLSHKELHSILVLSPSVSSSPLRNVRKAKQQWTQDKYVTNAAAVAAAKTQGDRSTGRYVSCVRQLRCVRCVGQNLCLTILQQVENLCSESVTRSARSPHLKSYRASPAIWDHTSTPARQVSTRFVWPGGIEGWVSWPWCWLTVNIEMV